MEKSKIQEKIDKMLKDRSKHLDLSNLNLRLFPEVVFNYESIEKLYLQGNELDSLPKQIYKFKKLRHLDLDNNKLSKIPKEIGDLSNLEFLDFNSNPLKSIPVEIGKLSKLEDFHVNWDNIESKPPIEVIHKGAKAITNYYRTILYKEVTTLYEAKLLIVGKGSVGKTSLLKKLIYDKAVEDSSTEGIDIHRWDINIQTINKFRINFWDFGGQEIYHSTHQFFLTKRSLYLLIWTARDDDDRSFDYWLNVIKLLSKSSPVIIVQNKIDERIKNIDKTSIQNNFKNVVEFIDTSVTINFNIEKLKNTIKQEIIKLEHIGNTLPIDWINIRNEMESLNKNYITYQEYENICLKYKLDKSEAKYLSQYYHDLGVLLNFEDNDLLSEIVFLKPEWATNAVYKIIDTKKVQSNYGAFNYKDLEEIWYDYPKDKYFYLLELMRKFELCFQIQDTHDYIIPELLKHDQPKLSWNYLNNLKFVYWYDFMPDGVIARFIVRNNGLIKNKEYWKNGVIIQYEEAEALIISDVYKKRIEVWTRGNDREFLMKIIRLEMNDIHRSLNNPQMKELIPCNCKECKKNDDPYYFEYNDLIFAQKKGKNTLECRKTFDEIKIKYLLEGIKINSKEENQNVGEINHDALLLIRADLYELKDTEERKRGFLFEKLLIKVFEAFNIKSRTSFRIKGEQIDGSIQFCNHTYLMEAKWTKKPVGNDELSKFKAKIDGKAEWARGLFISYSGFSSDGLEAFKIGKPTRIIGMDINDLQLIIDGQVNFSDALEWKTRVAAEENSCFVSLVTLKRKYG